MNKDLKHLDSNQVSKTLRHNSRPNNLHSIQGVMIRSLYDPTKLTIKKASVTNDFDILKSINRKTGLQFQSISEISQHVDTLVQKKLLTD